MSLRAASSALMAARAAVEREVDDLPTGTRVIVACSGGPDSLALAGATAWIAARHRLTAHAVVVDHGLQPGSAAVAERAVRTCLALGLAGAESVAVYVRAAGGPEAAARTARYGALADAAARHAAPVVLLGHTRDDQAETVLLRLSRGSGARALGAMRPRSDPWRRPFLDLARTDVHAAAAELLEPLGETAWHDPHNDDPAYARVRVRGVLNDIAEALGDGVVLGLSRSAELLRDDANALDAQADAEYSRLVVVDRADVSVDCGALLELARALRTRVIRLMGLRSGCPGDELGFDHVAQIEALVVDWHGQGELRLPGGVVAKRAYGRLCLLQAGLAD